MSRLLIVFCKNPVLGKVKTRLAKSIGEHGALMIYDKLLDRTLSVAKGASVNYAVYYDDFVNEDDRWNGASYKQVQVGDDIGARMFNAIGDGFERGFESVILVGSDIYSLTSRIIEQGFQLLEESNVVLGPAKDGGYYLVGMKAPRDIFQLNEWSTDDVLRETIQHVKNASLTYSLLEELNDVDTIEDLNKTDLTELVISVDPGRG